MSRHRRRRRLPEPLYPAEVAAHPPQKRTESETSRVLQILETIPDPAANQERQGPA